MTRRSRPITFSSSRMAAVSISAVFLLGALLLTGCGVTINYDVGGGVSTPGTTQPGGSGGSLQTSPGTNHGGTVAKPCAGAVDTSGKPPTIVLTVKDSYKTTQAHVGDVIEVQLSAKTLWSASNDGIIPVLTPLQPQGGLDEQTQTCRWRYTAAMKGSGHLAYTGGPNCEPNVACPAIAEVEEFIVQVS